MDSLNHHDIDDSLQNGSSTFEKGQRSPIHNGESKSSSELSEIAEILKRDLTPNKRAIIETLISAWDAQCSSATNAASQQDISGEEKNSREKEKNKEKSFPLRYPHWNREKLQWDT